MKLFERLELRACRGWKAPRHRVNVGFSTKEYERTRTEGLIETSIRTYQKTVAFESSYRDQGGRDRRVHAGVHRLARQAALGRRVCRQRCLEVHDARREREGARSLHAEAALETALLPATGGVPPVRRESGGLSVGGAVGAGHQSAVQCRGRAGARVKLAGRPVGALQSRRRRAASLPSRWSSVRYTQHVTIGVAEPSDTHCPARHGQDAEFVLREVW